MTKHISIIGCGWLGLPLAKQFISNGCSVNGSTTSLEKIEILKSIGIDAFYVEVTEEGVKGAIANCLNKSEILILNIPPGLRRDPKNDFVSQMRLLIPYIESSTIKKVVFISSTSVYGDNKLMPIITESTTPNPDSEGGKQLLIIENLFQKNANFQTTILRFSGLFGDDRHPANYLSGKSDLKNPKAPVNLIHQKDCIGIIMEIVQQEVWNELFNASTTPHPTRKDYYTAECLKLKLPLPEFDDSNSSKGKLINSKKLMDTLEYHFQVKLE